MTREEFKELRERAGFTQEKAAQVLGVSVGTVRNWEQGRAKIFTLTAKGIEKVFQESYEVN